MLIKTIFTGCLAIVSFYVSAQKKVNRQYFIDMLNEGNYAKVFDSAVQLRNEVYGKNAVVDYFIAKSLCLDGHNKSAVICFNKIINNFKLEGNKKTFIEKEINTCSETPDEGAVITSTRPDYSYINNISLPEASVGGKLGRVYDCFAGNQTINLTKMVSQEELESRLFPIDKKDKAVKKIRSIVGDQYRIDTVRRYVFVSSRKFPLNAVNSAADRLEKAYLFFIDFYGLRAPDKLLTVYILGDQKTLRQTASLIHGIELPLPNIGYSNLSDLSLLGLGDSKHLGTLYHELFHLLVRTDVGDIPAFLDEGLASLYSVSSWDGNKLVGDYRPWRLDELKEASNSRDRSLQIPALDKLINYSWGEFDGAGTKNICQVAVNYALSNFLMIYLQEKNLLRQMVNAFKNRPFVPLDSNETKSNVKIFEEVVKDSIEKFTQKFEEWFYRQYHFRLYNPGAVSSGSSRSIEQEFEFVRTLLYSINEGSVKYTTPDSFKLLQKELQTLEDEYRKLPPKSSQNLNNAPVNMVRQSADMDSAEVKRNELQQALEAYEKKLKRIIFERLPKTAN